MAIAQEPGSPASSSSSASRALTEPAEIAAHAAVEQMVATDGEILSDDVLAALYPHLGYRYPKKKEASTVRVVTAVVAHECLDRFVNKPAYALCESYGCSKNAYYLALAKFRPIYLAMRATIEAAIDRNCCLPSHETPAFVEAMRGTRLAARTGSCQ